MAAPEDFALFVRRKEGNMSIWKEAGPEAFGIPAEAVEKLEQLLDKRKVRLHGYMLTKGDCILAEKYYAPFRRESLHHMYSITKSFTALAALVEKLTGKKMLDYMREGAAERICHDAPDGGNSLRLRTQGKCYTCYPNVLKWEKVSFNWEKGRVSFVLPEGEFSFGFGSGTMLQPFLGSGYSCQCQGEWKMGHFILNCHVIGEDMGSVRMDFAWKDSRMSVRTVCAGDMIPKEMKEHFQGFASGECRES